MKDSVRVVIIGGGFGGVGCALRLCEMGMKNMHIRLISANPNFEYHGAMYRVVTGKSPMEVVFPLQDIFSRSNCEVEFVEDRVVAVDLDKNVVCSDTGCTYDFDDLVLALGSETSYFNTPGLAELSYGYKSIHEAIALKKHVQALLSSCVTTSKDQQVCDAHFVVVGGGPSGTELAGELVVYAKRLARVYGIDPSLVSVDLIQSANRLVPQGSERLSAAIETRLRSLGVNVFLNRKVVKEEVEEVFMRDMEMKTKTVIWTAGTKAHSLLSEIEGLPVNDRGQVEVNEHLQVKGLEGVWGVGDCAAVKDSGMAQAALYHGKHVAGEIAHRHVASGGRMPPGEYAPREWVLSVPVGPGWAATEVGGWLFTGLLGWWGRKLLDWFVFWSVLPVGKAWEAFRAGGDEWQSA